MAASVTISGFNPISASISDPQNGRRQDLSFNAGASKSSSSYGRKHWKRAMIVRAQGINPEIRKSEEKVVDSVVVTELSKNITPYCRCWRSGTFPLCDGSHVKHNKATGDNVGPLLLKKQ